MDWTFQSKHVENCLASFPPILPFSAGSRMHEQWRTIFFTIDSYGSKCFAALRRTQPYADERVNEQKSSSFR